MTEFQTYQGGFRKLVVWQEAHKLTLFIYNLAKSFPDHEKFGITSQMRRAASSIGANIAEGSGRKTEKDQNLFYTIARSSLIEIDNFGELIHDLKYISDDQYKELLERINKVGYLISKLINRQPK